MPRIISIGGVSRSGKTSLAHWLHQQIPNSIMLCQDDFPNDESHINMVRDRHDWEQPNSINWQNWYKAMDSMQDDCEWLILEGLFIFRPESDIKADHTIYLSMEKEAFLELRRQETRWGPEPEWYIEHVWNSHLIYGLPPESLTVDKFQSLKRADYPSILDKLKA